MATAPVIEPVAVVHGLKDPGHRPAGHRLCRGTWAGRGLGLGQGSPGKEHSTRERRKTGSQESIGQSGLISTAGSRGQI